MWRKLIGAGLLLLCGGLWANGKIRRERQEIKQTAALCELFLHIGEQIETLCLPLNEILSAAPPALCAACGLPCPVPLSALSHLPDQVRDTEVRTLLARVTAQLGRGNREDQVRLCRATAHSLAACRDRLTQESFSNARVRRTLLLTAILGIIILLW